MWVVFQRTHRGSLQSVCVFASALPVELVDVLDVAEQSADLLWPQRQSAAVDDAAQIVLQDRHREPIEGLQAGM